MSSSLHHTSAKRPPGPPPAPLSDALALVAPIQGFGDASLEGDPHVAWLFPSRRAALQMATRSALQHPTHTYGVFTFADAFMTAPAETADPRSRDRRSTLRLKRALADYLGAPPSTADGPQLNAARQLLAAL